MCAKYDTLAAQFFTLIAVIEQFSNEFHETKTKVTMWPITTDADNSMNQSQLKTALKTK